MTMLHMGLCLNVTTLQPICSGCGSNWQRSIAVLLQTSADNDISVQASASCAAIHLHVLT